MVMTPDEIIEKAKRTLITMTVVFLVGALVSWGIYAFVLP